MSNKLKLSPLRNAITSLADRLNVVSNNEWFSRQSTPVQNTLIAGIIQNFEFVYEISVKMIKRQIEAEALSPIGIDHINFRDILRIAAENGLIDNITAWFHYREMRNTTSHTYDHEKARIVYEGTLSFINDARGLLEELEKRNA